MDLKLKIPTLAVLALSLAVAGCGKPAVDLCDSGSTNPIGETSYSQVFNEAAENQRVCFVNASDLNAENHYRFSDGLLVIDGDIEDNVTVTVSRGKLYIDGDVGEGSDLSASVPEDMESYTVTVLMPAGKVLIPTTQTRYRFDGYTFAQDHDPAIVISGDVASEVDISSNHGVHISGDIGSNVDVRHSRSAGYDTVTTGQIPELAYRP